uniref:Uncharacterized protein n=1 Tax=Romanomermis culicivorax TaxID=13658 RepID=A0A915KEP8_ROMCU
TRGFVILSRIENALEQRFKVSWSHEYRLNLSKISAAHRTAGGQPGFFDKIKFNTRLKKIVNYIVKKREHLIYEAKIAFGTLEYRAVSLEEVCFDNETKESDLLALVVSNFDNLRSEVKSPLKLSALKSN